jgi:hypothetical protein
MLRSVSYGLAIKMSEYYGDGGYGYILLRSVCSAAGTVRIETAATLFDGTSGPSLFSELNITLILSRTRACAFAHLLLKFFSISRTGIHFGG